MGCTLDVHVRDNEIAAVTPNHASPTNRGHACVKGRFAHGFIRSGDRLTTPLLRRNGQLEPASWDEAISFVAGELKRIRDEHGPNAIAAISSARATNEENYLVQKLMRTVIGTNNVDNCSRLCHSPSAAGLTATFGVSGGTNPFDDFDRADCFLLAGSNPTEAHPVVGARMKQRVIQGARLIVVDPRRIELARYADIHLRPRPGGNVAVFNGLAHVLLEEGLADEAFLAERADGLDELREVLRDHTPERVEELTGVPASELRRAARMYGEAGCAVDRLRARHHRARARHRRCADAREPCGPDRAGRDRGRRRRQPAARAEQRPGRLRHGRAARSSARLPAGARRRRGGRASRA